MTPIFRRLRGSTALASAAVAAACLTGASSGSAALPPAPAAQPAPLAGFVTDAPVNALARSGPTVFLGGEFSRIGPATGGGVVS